jgi:glycosyltransferase involved in cell wall biosynthesis
MKTAVVVPVFNEETRVVEVIKKILKAEEDSLGYL